MATKAAFTCICICMQILIQSRFFLQTQLRNAFQARSHIILVPSTGAAQTPTKTSGSMVDFSYWEITHCLGPTLGELPGIVAEYVMFSHNNHTLWSPHSFFTSLCMSVPVWTQWKDPGSLCWDLDQSSYPHCIGADTCETHIWTLSSKVKKLKEKNKTKQYNNKNKTNPKPFETVKWTHLQICTLCLETETKCCLFSCPCKILPYPLQTPANLFL